MDRKESLRILKKYVKSENLLRHSFAVEGAMRSYARHFKENEELWGNLGLLHDIDFEKYPKEHLYKAPNILKEEGLDKDFIDAVVSHGLDKEDLRTNTMRKTLSAVDQMSSFILAVSMVRPTKLEGLKAKSVKKKIKDKAFSKAVDREYLEKTRQDLGFEFGQHVQIIVEGLKEEEKLLNKDNLSFYS